MAGRNKGAAGKSRWVAVTMMAWMLACCGVEHRAGTRAVSSRTLNKLEAGSGSLEELSLRRTATGYAARGSWGAPSSVEVPMNWNSGLPHIPARVNGREVGFIVDSGSQGTVLEADTALRCGVRTAKRSEGKFSLSGISGSESALMGVPERVEIGDWHWEGMPCLVRTTQSEMSRPGFVGGRRFVINVLGLDVMRRMCSFVTLDYPEARVIFGFRDGFNPDAGRKSWRTPMVVKDGLLYVRVGDGRSKWMAVVDTGSSFCVEVGRDIAERGGLRQGTALPQIFRIGVGASKSSAAVAVAGIRSLELLGPPLLNVPAVLVPDSAKIGSGLFRQFRVTLDFRRSVLWLESSR